MVEQQRAAGEQQPDVYCTGSTLPTRSCSCTKSSSATRSSRVVHGVNGSHDGRTSMPAARSSATARAGVGGRCGPCRGASSTASSTDSNADTTNRQPAAANSGHRSVVAQHVLDLHRAVERERRGSARASPARRARECGGALRKSGSPKVMCCAPAATSCAMSASTATSSSRGRGRRRRPAPGSAGTGARSRATPATAADQPLLAADRRGGRSGRAESRSCRVRGAPQSHDDAASAKSVALRRRRGRTRASGRSMPRGQVAGEARRRVHRHRERDLVGPVGQRRIPGVDRHVDGAHVVAQRRAGGRPAAPRLRGCWPSS